MLQAFSRKFRRCVRALVLTVVALAVIFAAPVGALAASNSPLIEAAKSGDTAEVVRLLAGGAGVDHQGVNGTTALTWASFNGHGAIVEALPARGAAIDAQNRDGITALIIASYFGRTNIVAALLANGANTTLHVRDGNTALSLAKNAAIKDMLRAAAKP